MHKRRSGPLGFATLFLGILLGAGKVEAVTLPAGFSDEGVANAEEIPNREFFPTALAFTPDGRLLIASKEGKLWVYQNGALLTSSALDLAGRICADRERGLLGVAVDPHFDVNHHVYLFYSAKYGVPCGDYTANRVSRFVLSDSNAIAGESESILLDNMPSPHGNHNAGDLQFGHDGSLYVTVGDGFCHYADGDRCGPTNDAAHYLNALVGKVLRIIANGDIPADNPFLGPDSVRCHLTGRTDPGTKCREIFASGLRNPFRMAFDPNTAETRFYINDVGESHWEEIDRGQAGADYGWNVREGPCRTGFEVNCGPLPPGMTDPLFAYSHRATGCSSITGGAFVPAGVWPVEYEGAYLFGDYVCGRIFALSASDTAIPFATGLGVDSAVTLIFGPHPSGQALYYTTFADTDGDGFPDGQVRRIAFVGSGNRAPQAAGHATPTHGQTPLVVAFSGRESSDADGDPLSFVWDFGDGTPPVAARDTAHTYGTAGTFIARLQVDDGRGGTDTDTIRIDPGHTPPIARITSPSADVRFRVGQEVTLSGEAVDENGLALPDEALRWTVRLHHDTHTHPFLDPTAGNDRIITTPQPEDLAATTTSFLEIRLTATDGRGLSHTLTQELRPKLVTLRFVTEPKRLKLRIQGTMLRTPKSIVSWPGYRIHLAAPRQIKKGETQRFREWSHGRPRRHTLTTPAKRKTYKAFFD